MTAGTNLTALMKGMSSLTAQLEIETILAKVPVQMAKLRHLPMDLSNTDR